MRQFVIKVFNDILFKFGCGTDDIMGEKIIINSLVNLKYFYTQMKFQQLMLTVYCMGKL